MIGVCSMLDSEGQTLVHCDHIFIFHLLIWVVDGVASPCHQPLLLLLRMITTCSQLTFVYDQLS